MRRTKIFLADDVEGIQKGHWILIGGELMQVKKIQGHRLTVGGGYEKIRFGRKKFKKNRTF